MIYKIYYQETKDRNPKREQTHSLYIRRRRCGDRTPYRLNKIPHTTSSTFKNLMKNILLTKKKNADFKLAEF